MKLAFAVLGPAFIYAPLSAQENGAGDALNRADFIVWMDAEFARLDRDGSRVLLPEEIEAVQRDAAQAEALRQNQQVFVELDKDASGMLDQQEFAALANPDAIPVDAKPLMTQFDTDRDGGVTLVEYRIVTQGNLDRIDTDRDGVVTSLEMRAAGIKP